MTLAGPARVSAFVGLGANLGDTARTLASALKALAALPETELVAVSSLYRSAPVDASGPDYLNAAARLETALPPEALLRCLQAIELAHGRERPFVNASRTLDLDLLLYAERKIRSQHLCVPHPRLHQRAFVLLPLLELGPDLSAPELGALRSYLSAVSDQRVERLPGG
ncbi:2-amino-4-hydroxy-6-hydroxymethyldihydropteridine diphosphokinase [Paucibacter sp. PLA-PC-4]|uniref:2-amino-4-hydroxy-6- hydroxymethyldihydropteridine diphosphokinase n=1 Tax=Paucibacter sp. PLA-PC-4 TaxID=2993655 RepID=UPI00224A5F2E|nr:2-amino-4-hydroxy-6-hydroxymethyldihydropteridine diphosphokinase [Paucibacter sp. PLA-PC-4]MCX2864737.1 2-amino-4-hydroxy-6-hydroxymethyldihydropteridine diphosphokinase [Paucibacter sp. PLA-PC-4]